MTHYYALPEATVLPPLARKLLQDAASVVPTNDDPLKRQKAIEQATKRVKELYPQFFRQDKQNETTD